MNGKRLLIILGTIIIIGITIVVLQALGVFNSLFAKKGTVTIHDKTIAVEVVTTEKDRAKGLSKRSSLAKGKGMLFVFDTADYHPFWMKDMKFPIDIVFIKEKKVVTIYRNVPAPVTPEENSNPPLYTPTMPADMVLELNAGDVDTNTINDGDTVTLTL